jgi:hypothetical protein
VRAMRRAFFTSWAEGPPTDGDTERQNSLQAYRHDDICQRRLTLRAKMIPVAGLPWPQYMLKDARMVVGRVVRMIDAALTY